MLLSLYFSEPHFRITFQEIAVLYTSLLYTAAQVRELDRLAISGLPDVAESGIPGIQLMKRAGKSVFDTVLECWPKPERLTVYCGTGNNGGDGYIIAAFAQQRNIPVTVIQVGNHSKLRGDARRAGKFAREQSVEMRIFDVTVMPEEGLIIDALLGTGLSGDVRAPFKQAIEQINASGLPVIAVDIPSGLNSDTGNICSVCVNAEITVSFIGLKRGLFTACGSEVSGEVFFDDLDVAPEIYEQVDDEVHKLDLDELLHGLPERHRNSHKGDYGHVLIIGGDHGTGGAVLMAAESAAHCGAGLVSVATQAEHIPALLARRPEVMAHTVAHHHALLPLLEKATVIVIGPGLGQTPWSEQLLYHALQHAQQHKVPLVLDADALNLLAEGRVVSAVPTNAILTPHPGEAAKLLQTTTQLVQQDRFAAVQALQEKYRATVVLKGAGTLIAAEGQIALCPYGNPGMSSGGMGDVLSGVLGALLAQHLTPQQAAALGVCLHSHAADCAAEEKGERGLLATDLIPLLQQRINFACRAHSECE
jgi:NAD(P)H-hydrate epimerase